MSSRNQSIKEDKEQLIFFSNSAKLFKFIGLWDDAAKLSTVKRTVIGHLFIQISTVLLSVMTVTGYFDLKSKGKHAKSLLLLICVCAYFVFAVKTFAIWYSVRGFKQCFRSLQDIARKFENQFYILKALKLYRILFILGLVFLNLTVSLYFCIPAFEGSRAFPFDIKNPVHIIDLLQSPFYEIIYAFQAIAAFLLCNSMISCDTLFCGVMAMVAAIIESINNVFEEAFILKTRPHLSEEEKLKIFARVIEDYIEICRIIDFVKGVFNLISLVHVMINIVIIGAALYFLSVLKFENMISIMMATNIFLQVFQLGIYCYFGEAVVQQIRKLRDNIYECDWYNQSKSFKVMTLLSLHRLENEPFISAGKVIPLSIATFGEVIKKATTFYAFLHNVK